jgi:hypothetical protein
LPRKEGILCSEYQSRRLGRDRRVPPCRTELLKPCVSANRDEFVWGFQTSVWHRPPGLCATRNSNLSGADLSDATRMPQLTGRATCVTRMNSSCGAAALCHTDDSFHV